MSKPYYFEVTEVGSQGQSSWIVPETIIAIGPDPLSKERCHMMVSLRSGRIDMHMQETAKSLMLRLEEYHAPESTPRGVMGYV